MASKLISPSSKPTQAKAGLCDCSACGCPLPGTIHTENGDVCGIHYLAPVPGWPKATSVIVNRADLLVTARKAQAVGLPQGANKTDARALLELAINAGVQFDDQHRESYKRALLKFRMAGQLVEQGITALAVAAAMTVAPKGEGPRDSEADAFGAMLRSLGAPA